MTGRQASLIKIQYAHAIFSSVQTDATQECLAPLNAPESWIMQTPAAVAYDFNSERRVLEHIQERHTLDQKDAQAKLLKQQESQRRQELLRKEAAELAEQEKRQAEVRRKLAEEKMLSEQKLVFERLNAEQQSVLRKFDDVVGMDSDISVRINFLQRFGWNLETTVAAFFEFEGDVSNIPQAPNSSPAPSPAAGKTIIQFVFPDGSKEDAEFEAGETLWDVFTYIYAKAEKFAGQNGFSLKAGDYIFHESDYDQPLQVLKLAPRATILISVE